MIGSTWSVPELDGGSVGPSWQMIRPFFRKRKSSKMRPLSRSGSRLDESGQHHLRARGFVPDGATLND